MSKALREKRHERFLQEDFDIDHVIGTTLGDICVELIETTVDDDSIDCICNTSGSGKMQLSCTATKCTLCDENRDVCAIPSFRYELRSERHLPAFSASETFILQYISGGRDDRIEIEMVGCDSHSDFCSECRAFVENEECNSCTLCGIDEIGFDINCENLAENSSFSTCDPSLAVKEENGSFVEGVKFLDCVTSPSNEECAGADAPMFPNDLVILGSTVASKYDGEPECLKEWRSPGMWYVVVGTGDTFRVDTCSNYTNFDTEISLYRGICGVSLECMGGNDDSCSGITSALQWKTEIGVLYYIKLHGHGLESVGNFGLTFSSFPSPINEMCSGAENLSIGMSSTGSTVGSAAIYDDVPSCGASDSHLFPSIWYTVQGNGNAITISTCAPGTEIFTSIAVYSGSCDGIDSLVCVAGSEYDYSCLGEKVAATVTWFASYGVDYYIQVLSEDGFGGSIELTMTESSKFSNDFCQTASEVVIDEKETVGLLEFSSGGYFVEPEISCGYTSEAVGAWYTVVGHGGVVSASTCSSVLSFGTSLSIFRGSCGSLDCIGWNSVSFDGSSDSSNCIESGNFFSGTVRWNTRVGEVYFILVQGIDSSPKQTSGEFSLSVESVGVPENDLCDNAEIVNLADNFQVTGSTTLASQDQSIGNVYSNDNGETCKTISSGGDLWYRVVGVGSVIQASTCHPNTNFDSQISVYASLVSSTSYYCDELECISTNDDDDDYCESNPNASQVSWFAEEGTSYLIRIHGFDQSAGEFVLTALSDDP